MHVLSVNTLHFRVSFYCQHPWTHLCNNWVVQMASLDATPLNYLKLKETNCLRVKAKSKPAKCFWVWQNLLKCHVVKCQLTPAKQSDIFGFELSLKVAQNDTDNSFKFPGDQTKSLYLGSIKYLAIYLSWNMKGYPEWNGGQSHFDIQPPGEFTISCAICMENLWMCEWYL